MFLKLQNTRKKYKLRPKHTLKETLYNIYITL